MGFRAFAARELKLDIHSVTLFHTRTSPSSRLNYQPSFFKLQASGSKGGGGSACLNKSVLVKDVPSIS